jgi:hypothetical protein
MSLLLPGRKIQTSQKNCNEVGSLYESGLFFTWQAGGTENHEKMHTML